MTEWTPIKTAPRMPQCQCLQGGSAARTGFRPRISPMANDTLPAQRRNRTLCPVRLASGPTAGSLDAYAYDSENGETNSFGYLREVTSGLPGMHTYDANGHLSAATSGSNPGDACTGGTGIVSLIYAGDNPVNATDPSGLCAGWGCVGYFADGVEQGIDAFGVTVLGVAAEGTSIASCAVVGPLCSVPIVASGGLFVGAGALAYLSVRSFVESGVIGNPPRRNVAPGPFGANRQGKLTSFNFPCGPSS